jgi:hypothetical protein
MKVKLLRIGLLCFVLFPIVRMYVSGARQIGTSSEIRGGNEYFSAGSDQIVVAWSVAAILVFALLMICLPRLTTEGTPRKWRRAVSDLIDFAFSLFVLSAISTLLPLWLESRRTGHFAWHFERQGAVNANSFFNAVGVFLVMFLMLCYFAIPLMLEKQSVGGCIMRIRMTSPFGADGRLTFRGALERAWYEFLWVCLLVSGVFPWSLYDQDRRDQIAQQAAAVLVADE